MWVIVFFVVDSSIVWILHIHFLSRSFLFVCPFVSHLVRMTDISFVSKCKQKSFTMWMALKNKTKEKYEFKRCVSVYNVQARAKNDSNNDETKAIFLSVRCRLLKMFNRVDEFRSIRTETAYPVKKMTCTFERKRLIHSHGAYPIKSRRLFRCIVSVSYSNRV